MATRISTPKRLMTYATEGRLTKSALASVLKRSPRSAFLSACATIERQYTVECAAANDPCLESGCSAEGEICLAPLLRAGAQYQKACGAEWRKLFADAQNRLQGWEADVAGWDL